MEERHQNIILWNNAMRLALDYLRHKNQRYEDIKYVKLNDIIHNAKIIYKESLENV